MRVEASRAPTARKRKKEEEEERMEEEEEEVYLYPVGLGTDVSIGALFYKYLSSFESIGKFFLCLSVSLHDGFIPFPILFRFR